MAYILLCTHTHTHTHTKHILYSFICWWTFILIPHIVGCRCSVSQSSPTLCNLKYYRTTGFPVLHHLPELSQIHLYGVNGAIQQSHSLPFPSCPQSFPASGSFQMSQLFISDGQSIAASALASVLPMNIQDWFPLGLTGWISLLSKGLSRVFSSTTIKKHHFLKKKKASFLQHSAFFMVHFLNPYMTTGKTILWLYGPLSAK